MYEMTDELNPAYMPQFRTMMLDLSYQIWAATQMWQGVRPQLTHWFLPVLDRVHIYGMLLRPNVTLAEVVRTVGSIHALLTLNVVHENGTIVQMYGSVLQPAEAARFPAAVLNPLVQGKLEALLQKPDIDARLLFEVLTGRNQRLQSIAYAITACGGGLAFAVRVSGRDVTDEEFVRTYPHCSREQFQEALRLRGKR